MAGTCCELTWLRFLLADLHMPVSSPAVLHCDNQAALHIAKNPIFHERTRHIEMDCHFIRDKIIKGEVFTRFVISSQTIWKTCLQKLWARKNSDNSCAS